MPGLDIYSQNQGFALLELTKSVNEMPFTPSQIAKMGIFEPVPISTTSFEVENYKGSLALIPDSPRGGVSNYNTRDPRYLRTFRTMHLPVRDKIFADEIQNVRAFGSLTDLNIAQNEMNKRLTRMRASAETTIEYGRLGALHGVILDADGSTTKYNLFTEFGISQTSVDFVLGTSTTEMLTKCTTVRDAIQVALGAVGTDDVEVVAFCGSTWFDKFVTHATVKDAYKYYMQNQRPLQEDLRYKGFTFGGITFIKYRGTVGSVTFQTATEANFFPVNIPDLFQTMFAPADYMETANTPGLPLYAKQWLDPELQKYVGIEVQTNPLSICTRPATLVKGTTSN